MNYKNHKEKIPYLQTILGIKRIGLCGSYSKGIQREESYVNIIVEFRKGHRLKFIEFSDHIENILGKKVDVHAPCR